MRFQRKSDKYRLSFVKENFSRFSREVQEKEASLHMRKEGWKETDWLAINTKNDNTSCGTLPSRSTLVLLFIITVAQLGPALRRRSASTVLMSPSAPATHITMLWSAQIQKKAWQQPKCSQFSSQGSLCVYKHITREKITESIKRHHLQFVLFMVVQNIHAFHSMAHSDGKNQSKAPWKDLISSNTAQTNYTTI